MGDETSPLDWYWLIDLPSFFSIIVYLHFLLMCIHMLFHFMLEGWRWVVESRLLLVVDYWYSLLFTSEFTSQFFCLFVCLLYVSVCFCVECSWLCHCTQWLWDVRTTCLSNCCKSICILHNRRSDSCLEGYFLVREKERPYIRQLEVKNHGHNGGSRGWNSALKRMPRVWAPGRGSFSPVATFNLCS